MIGRRLIAVVLSCLTVVGCGSGGDEVPLSEPAAGVRIASFDFAESELIAELYGQVLEAAGFDVVRLGAVGPREVVAPSLELGLIDVVPEYAGTARAYFAPDDDAVADVASVLRSRGLVMLEPAPAQDVNVFVVTAENAGTFDLATVSDLADLGPGARFGGPVECPDRPLCLGGLASVYGLVFDEFVPHRSLAITAEALIRGEVEVGVMFSTAAELSIGDFVVLADDKGLQPKENIVPLVRTEALERWGPGLASSLDRLSEELTTEALQRLNRRVADGAEVAEVAAQWLEAVGADQN